MNLNELRTELLNKLNSKEIENSGFEADLFIEEYLGFERHEIILNQNYKINMSDLKHIEKQIERRLNGEPVAYIFGYKHFFKSKFLVNKHVLIPRPETELLVEQALNFKIDDILVLDMGTGSGCIGLSVVQECTNSKVVLIDKSTEAISVAKENAKAFGVEGLCDFLIADINKLTENTYLQKFDVILANPPYIDRINGFVEKNVKKFEPEIALFSNEDGFLDIKIWIDMAYAWLKKGGLFLMEFGDNQEDHIKKILKDKDIFMDISFHKDYSGLTRYLKAYR